VAKHWIVMEAVAAARYDELPLTNVPLFADEDFSGCLLGFRPGQILPRHRHSAVRSASSAHEHEVFVGVAGTGTLWLDGECLKAAPGTVIFVPAGVEHGFENDGDEPWLIRATIHYTDLSTQGVPARHGQALGPRDLTGVVGRGVSHWPDHAWTTDVPESGAHGPAIEKHWPRVMLSSWYLFTQTSRTALFYSVIVTLAALLIFGAIKGRFTGTPALRSGLQTLLVGGVAAAAVFLIARAIS
jgi:quercetin dioxygenase-like cupin family protein